MKIQKQLNFNIQIAVGGFIVTLNQYNEMNGHSIMRSYVATTEEQLAAIIKKVSDELKDC